MTINATAQTSAGTNGESAATRNYELGREVAVSNTAPGAIKRISVAVALSAAPRIVPPALRTTPSSTTVR